MSGEDKIVPQVSFVRVQNFQGTYAKTQSANLLLFANIHPAGLASYLTVLHICMYNK